MQLTLFFVIFLVKKSSRISLISSRDEYFNYEKIRRQVTSKVRSQITRLFMDIIFFYLKKLHHEFVKIMF